MIIREIMSIKGDGEIFGIDPNQLVSEAVKRLVELDVGSLVVRQGETMVGFVTERDIIRAMSQRGCALVDVKISEIMTTEPVVGTPDDTIDYVRDVMTKERISHLPVVDGSSLVGVISYHDVAKACLKEVDFENALLKRYIKHWPEPSS